RFALNARQTERRGLSNGLNPAENIRRAPYTAHKKTRRFRRDEGGRVGLRFIKGKKKSVIVCEGPPNFPFAETISFAAHGGDTDKNTGADHARHCHRVLKTVAALRADRHGRDAVAFRKPQAVTCPVAGPFLLFLVNLSTIVAAGDAAEAGAEILSVERL